MDEISSKQDIGTKFEDRVRDFFKQLKLEWVSETKFNIAPRGQANQIDVAAKINRALIIIECKASGKRSEKDFRSEILEFKQKIRLATQGISHVPEVSDCNKIIPVFATSRCRPTAANLELLTASQPNILHVDEQFLQYYDDLYDKIEVYAKYSLLADLKIRPQENEKLDIPSISSDLRGIKTFLFLVDPKKLLKYTYVARREVGAEEFYQRMIEKQRILKIQKFIDESLGIFPTNLVISLKNNNDWEFQPSQKIRWEFKSMPKEIEAGILTIKNNYGNCWVIDGQHRLYSFANSKSNCLVPCIAFANVNMPKERSFFLEINREQKPIKSDLIWDLDGQADPECNKPNGLISNIVRELNACSKPNHENPFKNKIYIP